MHKSRLFYRKPGDEKVDSPNTYCFVPCEYVIIVINEGYLKKH